MLNKIDNDMCLNQGWKWNISVCKDELLKFGFKFVSHDYILEEQEVQIKWIIYS